MNQGRLARDLVLRLLCSLLLSLSACDDDPAAEAPLEIDARPDAALGPDAALQAEAPLLRPDGDDLELSIDGRTLITLSGRVGVELHQVDLTVNAPLGIFEVQQSNKQTLALTWAAPVVEGGVTRLPLIGGGVEGAITVEPAGDEATRLALSFTGYEADALTFGLRCDAEGSFHGFGEQYNATDQRGEAFPLMIGEQGIGREGQLRPFQGDAHTTYFAMPYLLDARGYGALLRTDAPVLVDLCQSDAEVARFEVLSGAPLEWIVYHGPTVPDVLRQLGDDIGRPKRPPSWAFDLWVSIQGGQQAVLDEVGRLEGHDIPLGAVWTQDWSGYRENIGGGSGVQYRWRVDEALYPDIKGLSDALEARGYRFLGYANPFIAAELDDFFPEMDAGGMLIKDTEGVSYRFTAPNGQSSHPDFTNPQAVAYVRAALKAMVDVYGFDGWMSDFGEWTPADAVLHSGADPLGYHNRFAVDWHATVRAALDAARPDGDYVTFGRSGWTGVQAHAMIHWIGDQEATWSPTDGLPTVAPAMINLGLSGQPFVTHDIGGFSGGPSTKELYLRWIELGAFTPVMRTHEGNEKARNWNWDGGPDGEDPETIAHLRRFARVHAALKPEIEAAADEAARVGLPIVRHMMLEFPEDRATWPLWDQYMLGAELLVAPVVEEGAVERRLYLPEGAWFDVWTGARHEGGGFIIIEAPLGRPPVLSRGADRADLRAITAD